MDKSYICYINLEESVERKKQVVNELLKIFPENKIIRLNAIKNNIGHIGCTQSHILFLKQFIESNMEFGFVFEDDFQLEMEPNNVQMALENLFKNNKINLALLSYHMPFVQFDLNKLENYFCPITNGQTTCSYVVTKNFAPTLLKNFEEGLDNLLKTNLFDNYCIDQFWKKLQTEENGAYGIVPRMGRQRTCYSTIEKREVNYGGFCFMIILTCEKYKERKNSQNLKGCPFSYKYFIGNPELVEAKVDGNTVYLPCGDNYENLPMKTKKAMEWVLNNYPNVDHIFKTDDDIVFHFNKLFEIFKFVSIRDIPYSGFMTRHNIEHMSRYHFGKCVNKTINNMEFKIHPSVYCAGGGYFVSQSVAKLIVDKIRFQTIFEDYEIGYFLNQNGIYPTALNQMNIHQPLHMKDSDIAGCYW